MWELEARNRVQVQKPKEGKLIGSLSHTAGLFVKPYLFNHQQSATHGNSVLARRDNSLRFCRGCSCVWRECVCFSHVPTSFYAPHHFFLMLPSHLCPLLENTPSGFLSLWSPFLSHWIKKTKQKKWLSQFKCMNNMYCICIFLQSNMTRASQISFFDCSWWRNQISAHISGVTSRNI